VDWSLTTECTPPDQETSERRPYAPQGATGGKLNSLLDALLCFGYWLPLNGMQLCLTFLMEVVDFLLVTFALKCQTERETKGLIP
jgi:hypothetical protein